MKKTIAFVSALAVVFCCSFPVFAVTAPGKTITTSYNYGDVSVNVSVNAMPTDTQVVGTSHYEHRFTVTLTNKTNQFQVASTNMFGLKLYTGNNYTFDSTGTDSSGSVYNLGSWGSEVTSYSDNMTVPTVQFYNSNSDTFKGCVFIKFYDTDLLVLNPNETRTYDFTIDFTCYLPASAVPFNGDIQFSYFTYNGNISIYNKPTSFTSNTIDQFIQNDSFPNSAIAWIMANYKMLSNEYPDFNIDQLYNNNQIFYQGSYKNVVNSGNPYVSYNVIPIRPTLISSDIEVNDVSGKVLVNDLYECTFYIYFHVHNYTDTTYQGNVSPFNLGFIASIDATNASRVGADSYLLQSENFTISENSNNGYFFHPNNAVGDKWIIPSGYSGTDIIKYSYYYRCSYYDDQVVTPTITYNTPNISQLSFTFSPYNQSLFYSISKNFADIRERIQSILDSYTANQQGAEDVTDSAESSSSTVDQQHQQESSIYDQTNQAVADTGIHNFKFDSQSLGGLGGVKNDFMAVWNALGSFNNIFITSLTIGLALSIIRHRRMFKS